MSRPLRLSERLFLVLQLCGVAVQVEIEAAGPYYKVGVREEGIYKISGSDLKGAGMASARIATNRLRMYYGGGEMLDPAFLTATGTSLHEIAMVIEDGGDGVLDGDDVIFFYGENLSRWVYDELEEGYEFQRHLYVRDNIYWLTLNDGEPGKRVSRISGAVEDSVAERAGFYTKRLHEEDEVATVAIAKGGISSGREWYWRRVDVGSKEVFTHVGRQSSVGELTVRVKVYGQSETPQVVRLQWNAQILGTMRFGDFGTHRFSFTTEHAEIKAINDLTFLHLNGSRWLLDWYELEFGHSFSAKNGELLFDVPASAKVLHYHLTDFGHTRPRIFQTAGDLSEIVGHDYDPSSGKVVFQLRPAVGPRRCVVLDETRFKRPLFITEDTPSNLQGASAGADYLIISHGAFADAAARLAELRETQGMRTAVVDVADIYDEFAAGLLDPSAIRNFLAYTHRNWDPEPQYVVLLGDGSYDYKNNTGISAANWIPPYEDGESTYDQWYVEVSGDDLLPDMAIGRLPVQTLAEAWTVVDKIIKYETAAPPGPWQGKVLLVADDTFNADELERIEPYFVNDAEYIAASLLPEHLEVDKLYLSDFPLEGRFKPLARDEFLRRFNLGAAIFAYIGHGNANVFAHEHIFVLANDLQAINNGSRLPFAYAAASQVGVFDDPLRDSIPEALLKKSDGGVVGMVAATRVGYHPSNMELANVFLKNLLGTDRESVPVGMALAAAKRHTTENLTNVRRYTLFGDPAMRLALPSLRVEMDVRDTLRALAEESIAGRVVNGIGNLLGTYTGKAEIQVFDSATERRRSEQGELLIYRQTGTTLYRALIPVVAGEFATVFTVPKDINYRGRFGRVSAYVWDGQTAGIGAVDSIVFSGTAAAVLLDESGPEIDIGFRDVEFENGDTVSDKAIMLVVLRDDSGINITGEIGHGIQLILDTELIDLTPFYVAGTSYREGQVEYPLPQLSAGPHTAVVEAWDTHNNWARGGTDFVLSESQDLSLSDALFFPNPVRDRAHLTFVTDSSGPAEIRIFSIGGRLVDMVEHECGRGYNQLEWVPPADLSAGAYIFQIALPSHDLVRPLTGIVQLLR